MKPDSMMSTLIGDAEAAGHFETGRHGSDEIRAGQLAAQLARRDGRRNSR